MKYLNKPASNLGGLLTIWAIPADQFYLYGNSITTGNPDNIYRIYCSPDSMNFSARSEKTVEGVAYNATLKGFAPGITSSLESALQNMAKQKWVVLFQDGNETFLIAGTKYFPLLFSSNTDTGTDTPDRAGCEFLFSGKIPFPFKVVSDPF